MQPKPFKIMSGLYFHRLEASACISPSALSSLTPLERRLTRAGSAVPLGPRALDVLTLLVRHAGHLVTKDAISGALWPDTVPEANALTVAAPSCAPRWATAAGAGIYIKTVYGQGYRFIAPVATDGPAGAWQAAASGPSLSGRSWR